MNLSSMLKERAAANKPVRIGQVGAGKFGTMFLSQVRLTTGMHLTGLADLRPHDHARIVGGVRAQQALEQQRRQLADREGWHRPGSISQ